VDHAHREAARPGRAADGPGHDASAARPLGEARLTAEVLSIGNEVLSGRTLDTNFQFLARLLEESGARVAGHQAIPDDPDAIAAALHQALGRADVVVCTGGLGPTPDDLTVRSVAAALGRAVALDDAVLASIRARWASMLRAPMPASNERQALLPAGATAWANPVGSAPGIHLVHEGRHVVLLPGVPEEMRALALAHLAPLVRAASGLAVEYCVIRTVGIAESLLEQNLGDLSAALGGATVAYLPGMGGVDVRIALPGGASAAERAALAERARETLRAAAGEFVYSEDDRALEEVVGDLLRARAWRLAVAESCTGGLLGGRITGVAGSSTFFDGGAIVYANSAKVRDAGVPPALLEAHGAVSEEVARALARGIAARFGTACGLAVTGIAGPDGGTAEKPVGTVHLAAVSPEGEHHRKLVLRGNRAQVRERSVTFALDLLRRLLVGLPAASPRAIGTPPPPAP
jgi:nicotinamide-nucleotide amidase